MRYEISFKSVRNLSRSFADILSFQKNPNNVNFKIKYEMKNENE